MRTFLLLFTFLISTSILSNAQEKLDEIYLNIYGNNTAVYQGYAAAGINFRVLSAGLVPVDIEYTVEINPIAIDVNTVESLIEDAIKNYINSLWVGADVIHSELIRLIQGISGVISVKELTLNSVEDDLETLPSQVARVSTIVPDVI